MKITVLGIGGTGGVVGACLGAKYDDIHFIARGKTLEAISKNGIWLESDMLGKINAKPASVTDNPDEIGITDILVICTKGYDLENAVRRYENIIGENTIILPLLNGVNVSKDIRAITDKGIVADGVIFVFSNIKEPGIIHHSGNMLKIEAGIPGKERNKRLMDFVEMLNSSGIKSVYSDNISETIWQKYVMMCGNSCAFAYFEESAGGIQKDPEKVKYVESVYNELVSLAKLNGTILRSNLVREYMDTFLALPENTITSLYRDIINNSPKTEFDSIIGKAYNMSRALKADTPSIDAVYKKYRG